MPELPGAGGSPAGAAAGPIADALPLTDEGKQGAKLGANFGPKGALIGAAVGETAGRAKQVVEAPKKLVDEAVAHGQAGLKAGHENLQKGHDVSHGKGGPVVSEATGKPLHGMPNQNESMASKKNPDGKSRIVQFANSAMQSKTGAAPARDVGGMGMAA